MIAACRNAQGLELIDAGERAERALRGGDTLAVRADSIRGTGLGAEPPPVKPGRRRDARFQSPTRCDDHAPVLAPCVEYETACRLLGRVDEPARRHRSVVAQAEPIEAALVGRAPVERRVLVIAQHPHARRGELALRAGVKLEVEAGEVGGPDGCELRTVVRCRTDALDQAAGAVLDRLAGLLKLVRCVAQLGQSLQQILGGVAGFGGKHAEPLRWELSVRLRIRFDCATLTPNPSTPARPGV